MSSDNVFNFTTENFQTKVIEANRPVFVLFWAVWNSPSREMQYDVEKLADKYVNKLKVGKVDVDLNVPICQTHQVQSVPMCLLFKDGVVVENAVSGMTYVRLEMMVKPYI